MRKTGNAKVAADTEHLITFDPKTCEPVAEELARHLANMPCAEAVAIEKAPEDFHHDVCTAFKNGDKKPAPVRRTTTPINDELLGGLHMEMPSVDALEEATAYAATVKAYDADRQARARTAIHAHHEEPDAHGLEGALGTGWQRG